MTDAPAARPIGLIGAGNIARLHAESAQAAGVPIAAVYDPDPTRAQTLAGRHAGAAVAATLDDLLSRDDVAAVVVAVPNHLHRELAIAALDAGKDVLLEKPMAMNIAQCDEVVAAVNRTGRQLQLNFVSRRAPAAAAVKRLIDAGRFGRIYHARAQWYRRRGIPGLGGWFTTKEQSGGGVLIDLGVHVIDLILHLTGRPAPRTVSAVCTSHFGAPIERYTFNEMWAGPPRPRGTFDVEDGAVGFLRFEGGLTAELSLSWAANIAEETVPSGILLLGEKAGCFFDVWGKSVTIASEQDGALVDVKPQLPPGEAWAHGWRGQHEAFRAVVAGSASPSAPATHGREVQVILDAMYRSAAEGREVAVG